MPPAEQSTLVEAARETLGVPYDLGGRLQPGRGLDCQGVLFYAAERIGRRCGWRSYDVMPSRAIPRGELGSVVSGLAPVASARIDLELFEPGDVLWLVGYDENPAEPASATLDGRPVWVWHTGLYVGSGRFVVGDHYAGRVVEEELLPYLERHRGVYAGVIVTRLGDEPKPRRCRSHAPMIRRRG